MEKLKLAIHGIQQEFHTLEENEVPKLIQDCREARTLRVLTGDYNLKLARQNYFTSNQDKVRHLGGELFFVASCITSWIKIVYSSFLFTLHGQSSCREKKIFS